jgi:CRISPR-associated protein Cmr6
MRYPLPKDTAAILAANAFHTRNLGLALDRLLPINDEVDEKGEAWKNPDDEWKLTDQAKRRENAPFSLGVPIPTLIRNINARRAAMLKGLSGFTVQYLSAEPDYRLVLGIGAEHILETNLCLHRLYGFPIIPASAVKGIARVWAYWEIADSLGVSAVATDEALRRKEAKEKTPLQILDRLLAEGVAEKQQETLTKLQNDPLCIGATFLQSLGHIGWRSMADEFYQIFGTTESRGHIIFFDAYPTQAPKLELDILNPHYSRYYRGETSPADYLDPVPAHFLTVSRGSSFQFAIAGKHATLANKVRSWLAKALADIGIGGKTSAGYGFMQVRS